MTVLDSFFSLTPERVLEAAEFGGRRATGYVLALNSLENRVYDVELEDDGLSSSPLAGPSDARRVVMKFYRPGRWSRAAIHDEHELLAELAEAELPVVPPLDLGGGETLGSLAVDGGVIHYAAFPRVRGRAPEELHDEQLSQLGRLVGRLHNVGARHPAAARPVLSPASYGTASRELLAAGPWIPADLRLRYLALADRLIEACCRVWEEPDLVGAPIRLHGDCHLGNLLWTPRSGPVFVDFDDFLHGPPVQDLWLLAPGHDAETERQREVLISAYETMRAFDRRTLRLCEPLRTLRILRYAAWIARRYDDPAFQNAFPDFTSYTYWHREIEALGEQLARLDAISC